MEHKKMEDAPGPGHRGTFLQGLTFPAGGLGLWAMPDRPDPSDLNGSDGPRPAGSPGSWRKALLERHRWIPFVLPLLVYMLAGSLEPTPEKAGGQAIGLAIPYAYYPWVYTAKLVLTGVVIALVFPAFRQFPFRVSGLSVVVGVVGIFVWVGICSLEVETKVLAPFLDSVGLGGFIQAGTRSGFDPFAELAAQPAAAWAFLAVRLLGLVAIVPLIEEVFYRGFLMRFVVKADWWEVPMGEATTMAVVLATVVPVLMHPAELLAATVWFSMVTWMYLRTRNLWDCVAAHAVTNALLGAYVLYSGEWRLM